jgi:hypothetical protein
MVKAPPLGPQETTFTFQDPAGNPLADGQLSIRLNTDASTTDRQIVASRWVDTTLNSDGSATVALWPNGELSPSGTVYLVRVYTARGQLAWDKQLTV